MLKTREQMDYRMSGRAIITLVLSLVCTLAASASAVDRSGEFTYDIFRSRDSIGIWIDLTPVLNQSQMEDLLSGLNIYIGVELRLESPRRLFFPRLIAKRRGEILIAHRLTADIYKVNINGGRPLARQFDDQMQMRAFIADSIEFGIAAIDSLHETDKYRLTLSFVSKSYSSNEMGGSAPVFPDSSLSSGRKETGLFESLFSTFIELVGFGKISCQITTPDFTLKDLSPGAF